MIINYISYFVRYVWETFKSYYSDSSKDPSLPN
ncbi:unnamed protein product, partial [Fusarium fujikuroi]